MLDLFSRQPDVLQDINDIIATNMLKNNMCRRVSRIGLR